MTKLQELFQQEGQSPWLDNLKRGYLTSGELKRLVGGGIRGVTSNPTIFQKAISGSADYDDQFRSLVATKSVEDAYWELVVDDITNALAVLRPVYDQSKGGDGFVSIEVAPSLANDTDGTIRDARMFHERIALPNLMVKIPATAAGIPAIQRMVAEGRNINITLIFSLDRYAEVMEAYISGLETYAKTSADLSSVHSVASFFVSRVDTEVDRRLEAIGSPEALALRGRAAVANAKLPYALFEERFATARWKALAGKGAAWQRPLWASTSTKNPAYPDTIYVEELIGRDTVNTIPPETLAAFQDHGKVRGDTVREGVAEAEVLLGQLRESGVDYDSVVERL